MSCRRRRGIRQVDVGLDAHRVAYLQRPEEGGVRLDPVIGLQYRAGDAIAVLAGRADTEPDRARDAGERECPADRPASVAVRLERGRGEDGLRIAVGRQQLARRPADIAPVPVGERLDAAGPLAPDQGTHIDAYLER